jgi:hypothetical protein
LGSINIFIIAIMSKDISSGIKKLKEKIIFTEEGVQNVS